MAQKLHEKYETVKFNLIKFYRFCPFSGTPINDHTWNSTPFEIDHISSSHRGMKQSNYDIFDEVHGTFVNSLINLRPLNKNYHTNTVGGIILDNSIELGEQHHNRSLEYNREEVMALTHAMNSNPVKFHPLEMEWFYTYKELDLLLKEVFQIAEMEIPFWFYPSQYVK